MEQKYKDLFKKAVIIGKEVLPVVATNVVYNKMFHKHINTYFPLNYTMSDYPSLCRDRYTFFTEPKHTLVGYMYFKKEVKQKAILVFAHGYGGGGHHCYLDIINYFASNGFFVFAYDATANDESEGDDIRGFPQGIIDLDHAINFVKSLPNYLTYPIFLLGHSWGAYSVSNVILNHPEIPAIAEISGFSISTDFIKEHAKQYVGQIEDFSLDDVDDYEENIFGELAKRDAVDVFNKVKTRIFVMHSKDDKVVYCACGYDKYFANFNDNSRFKFKLFVNRNHTPYHTYEGIQYENNFNKELNKYIKEYKPNDEQKYQWIEANIDRHYWAHRLDENLMEEIKNFFFESI